MLTQRTCSQETDLRLIQDLLAAVRPAKWLAEYPSLNDLHEMLAFPEVQENTRLWFDASGKLVACVGVDRWCNLWFEVDRQVVPADFDDQILAWGEQCIRRMSAPGGPAEGEDLTLDGNCREDDTQRLAFYQKHGFEMQAVRTVHMERSLLEHIREPMLPAGFSLRHVTGEGEVEDLVRLHRAAFGTDNMTVEERLAMMRTPSYEKEMDLLVVAPDGRLAGFCVCWIDAEQNERTGRKEGYTDPVGTHPDFQGQGAAKALLLAGMKLLRQRGMEVASLGTSSENIGMQRAAEGVGFRVVASKVWFSKEVV